MLGSAVSSNIPIDFQPSPVMGWSDCPATNRYGPVGPTIGCPYAPVGMQRALDSAIGFPRSSTSASRMLAFLMPAEVRRSFRGCSFARVWVLSETAPRHAGHRLRGQIGG